MKRSSAIALTAMGAGTLAMVAVGNEVTRASRITFATVAACAASGQFTEEQCREAETDAQGLVARRARAYDTAAACHSACGAGNCTPAAPYTARMIGFAIGKSRMSGAVRFQGPIFAGNCVAAVRSGMSRSSYYSGSGPWRGDARTGRGSGTHTHSDPTTRSRGSAPSTKSPTVSRGGFGGSRSSGSS
jgi:uncharacterized protein YgiB involved in biofilm formation